MTIEYATALDTGIRKRQHGGINEDSVAVNVLEDAHLDGERTGAVFVLADGAGGEEAGDVASYLATVEVTRRLTQALWDCRRFDAPADDGPAADDGGQLDEAAVVDPLGGADADYLLDRIETAIQSTHTRILQTIETLDLEGAYTTIVAGVVAGDRLYYGWVGDSRAYVVNGHPDRQDDEQISRLTRDHSVVERLVQQGEIDPIEAHVHPNGNQLTRALGGRRDEEPSESTVAVDTNHVELFGDDAVVFTSDGLIDAYADAPDLHEQYENTEDRSRIEETILEKAVTDDEIRDVVLEADSLEAAAGDLVTLANKRGGKDNVSVVLFGDPTLDESPADGLPARTHDSSPEAVGDVDTVIGDPES